MSEYTQERLRSLLYRTQKKRPLMPPPVYPVTIDDNLVFLWRAIQHSNYTKIDFNLLGDDFQLNREEALECFRELRRAIEDAVYNNYMEKSNDRRDSASPSNIFSLIVRRRKEAADAEAAAAAEEDAAYEEDEAYYEEEHEDEYAHDKTSHAGGPSHAGSKAGPFNVRPSSAASLPACTSKTGPPNAKTSSAGPSRVGTPYAGSSKADSSSAGTSNVGPTNTGHLNAGLSKQGSSVAGPPASDAGPLNPSHSNPGPSNEGASQAGAASARPSSADRLNASHPNIRTPRAVPFNVGPFNAPLNAGNQSTGHPEAVHNPTMNYEAGQASENVKLAPIRAGQTINFPLPRITNHAGPPAAQPPNVGFPSTFPPRAIPAPGFIGSGPPIARPSTIAATNYFPHSVIPGPGATSLTSMMTPQPSNQTPSQIEEGPVVLDITGLRCFLGVVDQGVGPTALNDKLFSRPDYFFPIRTPFSTAAYPYGPIVGPDASRASEPQLQMQLQATRPSLPSLSSLQYVPPLSAGRASSPAKMDKGKKRKRESGPGADMEGDESGKDKDPEQ